MRVTAIKIVIYLFIFYLCNPTLAQKLDMTAPVEKTFLDSISDFRPPNQAFHEIAEYATDNPCLSIKYIERNWAGNRVYIEKAEMKNGNAHFIRVRIYILSIHPAGIDCGIIVRYYRESWYNKDDENFIDGELHPYSSHKKALVDLNLFWNDPEYVGKTYQVRNTVLRNMNQNEKEVIQNNAKHFLFILNQ